MPHGKLTVIVESAIGIKDPSKHGRGDSYCTLQCGSQVLSTHVAEGGGSRPVFHTEFNFEIDRSTNDLVISVYSTGFAGDDELVGFTTLVFKTVFFHAHAVALTAYPLTRRSGKAAGHISVSLKFKARPPPQVHNNPHALKRENSAPPHAAPHLRAARNQQSYETYDDGYGSSGSESSLRGSSNLRSGGDTYRRSQSQPEHVHHRQPQVQPADYHHARPSSHQAIPAATHQAIPAATHQAIPAATHQAIPAATHQAIPAATHQAIPAATHQAIPAATHRAIPNVVHGGIRFRPGPPQQQHPMQQQQLAQRAQWQAAMHPQQQPAVAAQVAGQVARAVAAKVVQQGIQTMAGGFGDVLGGLFNDG